MYTICPKCGHERGVADKTPADRCPACGILFQKWLRQQLATSPQRDGDEASKASARSVGLFAALSARALDAPPRVNAVEFWARGVAYVALSIWGVYFIFTDWSVERGPFREIGNSFMHNVNLVFHEAGHLLFIPLGDFMSVAGGSLMQLIVPLVVMLTFFVRYANAFGASIGLWWFAQSCMDLAPYIGDARRGELLLLGGVTGAHAPGYHDWSNLLGRTGLLHRDQAYATAVDVTGETLMWAAIAWGGAILLRQYRNIDSRI